MEITSADIEKRILAITQQFLTESGSRRVIGSLNGQSLLERDLGVGSLERTELFHRIEKAFNVQLSNQVLADAETIADLVKAVASAKPSTSMINHDFIPALEMISVDPSKAKTLVEVLQMYVQAVPDRPHIYLQNEQGVEQCITYKQLYTAAQKTAVGLLSQGLQQGDPVAIMVPTGEDFFAAFFGALLAGGFPVPIYPPFRPGRIEEYAKREISILTNAQVRFLVTFGRAKVLSKILQSFVPSLKAVTTVSALQAVKGTLPKIAVKPNHPILIQYSSGSTGVPKGVLLHHENMLANIHSIAKALQIRKEEVVVSWLPLYHDMGLMGWIGSLYFGIPVTIMSPLSFLSRPERWLWTIHYHRASFSAGPNFAYEMCVRKIDDAAIEGLDLSSWRLALNGAEAINPNTIRRFIKRFKPYGFKAKTMFPMFGLAEATVALAAPKLDQEVRIDKVDHEAFAVNRQAIPVTNDHHNNNHQSLEFVSCGHVIPDHQIRIVNENGKELPERHVGTLEFTGPSAMQCYYHNPEATKKAYHDGWWDTGDYAYIADQELFVTGRKKDIIIKAGRNIYPEEIEQVVNQIDDIRKGCVIAFGVNDPRAGTEKLIIVAETNLQHDTDKHALIDIVVDKVAVTVGMPPDLVHLVPPRTVPKTSSGKLQRSACKEKYINGDLVKPKLSARWQFVRLGLKSFGARCVWFGKLCLRVLYTVYALLLLILLVIPTALCTLFLPRKSAFRLTRRVSRFILRISGSPLTVVGRENIRHSWPVIYVANHSSYIDSLVLLAILPGEVAIVGKKELAKVPILNLFFRRLELPTVDRWDFSKSMADTKKIKQMIEEGRSILIFPEGTFTYATGLRPFRAGAFQLAVDTKTALCPIGMQGTRNILRGNSVLARPGRIKVTITKPIAPEGDDWHEVIRLRNISKAIVGKHCGEHYLDLARATEGIEAP